MFSGNRRCSWPDWQWQIRLTLVIAMATKTVLTLEQFMALPETEADGTHYELSEGELIKLSPDGYLHAATIANIAFLLRTALSREEYVVVAGDAGYLLDPNPEAPTVRGADVGVNRRADVGENLPRGWFPGPPLLAVEVISVGNRASDMHVKVKQYLKAGSLEVWLVYPDTQTLYVYSAGRRAPQVYEEDDEFTSVLGMTFRTSDLFRI
jgi:Uma2 family endonuclease